MVDQALEEQPRPRTVAMQVRALSERPRPSTTPFAFFPASSDETRFPFEDSDPAPDGLPSLRARPLSWSTRRQSYNRYRSLSTSRISLETSPFKTKDCNRCDVLRANGCDYSDIVNWNSQWTVLHTPVHRIIRVSALIMGKCTHRARAIND
eukprot:2885587-Pyramimonas_sp.AAC.1